MSDVRQDITAALQRELGSSLETGDLDVTEDDGVIRLRGTVRDIEAKRRALQIAVAASGTRRIRDDLHLPRDERQSDAHIVELLDMALRTDSAFQGIPIDCDRQPQPDRNGSWVQVEAHDGVLRMEGQVPTLTHRRLAEVMAWWTPGSVDVDNRLHVQPPEQDNDHEIADVVRHVFDKDRAIDAELITVLVRDAVVILRGHVDSHEQAERAERHCWYVPGVHDVRNELRVAGGAE
jgi:osmotically-inducible protein OsmY